MVTLDVRIELYEQVAEPGARSVGMYGAMSREDALEALSVPAVGESIAISSLRAAPMAETLLQGQGTSPFLPVRQVEHYPVPVRDGKPAAWYNIHPAAPSATVVLHALGTTDPAFGVPLLAQFAADGWDLGFWSHSEMYPLYEVARNP
ncbi:hypothetical protein JQK87_13155 [Streptomyces sp. G44]|uniref:hypothetical protein n=1 Tax=Streptomyces sp. G44 TaxID=2807632 RepID=UPI0019617DC5|nr:hypothetical protein [Streptomyces sp. G44]MBM7169347.1 hypothetical protein [Streptomyces sp. G44]